MHYSYIIFTYLLYIYISYIPVIYCTLDMIRYAPCLWLHSPRESAWLPLWGIWRRLLPWRRAEFNTAPLVFSWCWLSYCLIVPGMVLSQYLWYVYDIYIYIYWYLYIYIYYIYDIYNTLSFDQTTDHFIISSLRIIVSFGRSLPEARSAGLQIASSPTRNQVRQRIPVQGLRRHDLGPDSGPEEHGF